MAKAAEILKDWRAERRNYIGASEAPRIMAGGEEQLALWLVKTGRKEPDDLSNVLPVQMGIATEAFHRMWFTKQTSWPITSIERQVTHPEHDFLKATLDGEVMAMTDTGAPPKILKTLGVFQAKHVGGFEKDDKIVARYYPQVQMELACSGLNVSYFSLLVSNSRWDYYEIERDQAYIDELLLPRLLDFWEHVQQDKPPYDREQPIIYQWDELKSYDMTGNNEWANCAGLWREHRQAAQAHAIATKQLKELIPDDGRDAAGHGVKVSRARNGSKRVSATKD